jgi:hypothetical protein
MFQTLLVGLMSALLFFVLTANTEGRLVIYGTTQLDHMDAMIQGFNKKYPAIKAQYLRQGRTAVYERILREQHAGVFNADIYGGVAGIQDVALRENVRTDMEPTGDLLKLKGIRYMKTNWDSIFGNLDVHYKAFRENFGLS